MTVGGGVFFGLFFLVWAGLLVVTIGGFIAGVSALVSVSRLPPEAFGPWWDNTKTAWLLGIGVSFLIPCGLLVTGATWFRSGKRALTAYGMAGRPFWIGPPRPPPPASPWPPAAGWGSPTPWSAPPWSAPPSSPAPTPPPPWHPPSDPPLPPAHATPPNPLPPPDAI